MAYPSFLHAPIVSPRSQNAARPTVCPSAPSAALARQPHAHCCARTAFCFAASSSAGNMSAAESVSHSSTDSSRSRPNFRKKKNPVIFKVICLAPGRTLPSFSDRPRNKAHCQHTIRNVAFWQAVLSSNATLFYIACDARATSSAAPYLHNDQTSPVARSESAVFPSAVPPTSPQ